MTFQLLWQDSGFLRRYAIFVASRLHLLTESAIIARPGVTVWYASHSFGSGVGLPSSRLSTAAVALVPWSRRHSDAASGPAADDVGSARPMMASAAVLIIAVAFCSSLRSLLRL
eukprot:187896-Hanusia_phi.AAC.1